MESRLFKPTGLPVTSGEPVTDDWLFLGTTRVQKHREHWAVGLNTGTMARFTTPKETSKQIPWSEVVHGTLQHDAEKPFLNAKFLSLGDPAPFRRPKTFLLSESHEVFVQKLGHPEFCDDLWLIEGVRLVKSPFKFIFTQAFIDAAGTEAWLYSSAENILALTGMHPCWMAGVWNGSSLTPLGIGIGDTYHQLPRGNLKNYRSNGMSIKRVSPGQESRLMIEQRSGRPWAWAPISEPWPQDPLPEMPPDRLNLLWSKTPYRILRKERAQGPQYRIPAKDLPLLSYQWIMKHREKEALEPLLGSWGKAFAQYTEWKTDREKGMEEIHNRNLDHAEAILQKKKIVPSTIRSRSCSLWALENRLGRQLPVAEWAWTSLGWDNPSTEWIRSLPKRFPGTFGHLPFLIDVLCEGKTAPWRVPNLPLTITFDVTPQEVRWWFQYTQPICSVSETEILLSPLVALSKVLSDSKYVPQASGTYSISLEIIAAMASEESISEIVADYIVKLPSVPASLAMFRNIAIWDGQLLFEKLSPNFESQSPANRLSLVEGGKKEK